MKKRILLVDGYNMIAFWQETRQLFKTNQLDEARETLLRKLNHYANFEHIDIICVFDAQFVNTVKSDLDKMSAHIDLKTPKLRPWDDAQLGKLQDLLNEIE